ncbi:YdeI/OmpD-associated family protein [Mucilaginibacter aquariorum]|uniref:YdeI/OmpD-associated family protein n=1 Tax=Mucilaginibacter aquariorum TaxID=2967225 RepID=A0ABT1T0C6_9SPHI|nr:YdeI/OmpD-associated family protein [Mucilaginibacter aquariorum]MCQ6957905.1 YdeI/OmpD-associated family protein [Mucilaginibacter aquariorum]
MNQPSPLAKKLLIKPGQRWLVMNAPEDYLATLEPIPDDVTIKFDISGSIDGVQVFVKNSGELAQALDQLKPVLTDDTIFWIVYPRKNSGIDSDLSMMNSWPEAEQHGLRPVAAVAINNIWSSLRFRPEHLVKKSSTSKEAIRKENDYSAYIDVDKKQITLPPYLHEALAAAPVAMATYKKLAWSHRKEYVVWILSAKQEETRINRITKMVDMLLAGKKNPSDK